MGWFETTSVQLSSTQPRMKNFLVTGRTWSPRGYKQIQDFTLSFASKKEADAAEAALKKLGQCIYVAPQKSTNTQQGYSNGLHHQSVQKTLSH